MVLYVNQNISEKINESVKENADIILVFGASAICDKNDIVPLSLKKNNGKIIRLGMPVEPGNLMLLGKIDHNNKIIFVLGMPRSGTTLVEQIVSSHFVWLRYI